MSRVTYRIQEGRKFFLDIWTGGEAVEGEYDTSRNKNGVVCESGDADSATLFSRFRRE